MDSMNLNVLFRFHVLLHPRLFCFVINNYRVGALCILLPNDNINHIFICRQLCTKSGSKKRTFPGQKLDQSLYKENAKNVGQAGNYVVHL